MRTGFVLLAATIALVACGGGTGTGPVMQGPVEFTSFSAVQPGQPVRANAISQTATALLGPAFNVLSVSLDPIDTSNSNLQLTYATGLVLNTFSATTPASSVAWSGSDIVCDSTLCTMTASSNLTIGVTPNVAGATLNWNYQTWGAWLSTSSNTSNVVLGVISAGAPTPVNAVPVAGVATYTGTSGGTYVDNTNGALLMHRADMISTVDFGGRTVRVFTSNTQTNIPGSTVLTARPDLNLNGTLTYGVGSNQFTGSITAPATPALIGTATGRFYGPTAQEIGGVFSLQGTGQQTMLGAFGGKR